MPKKKASMEEPKKRKIAGGVHVSDHTGAGNDQLSNVQLEKNMRLLLAPLGKDQLVDLLVKIGLQVPDVAEEIRGIASTDPVHRKLFVRGLAWETTSETLCDAFSVHGEIEEGAVVVDKSSGKSRGFGFITYKNIDSTQKALEEPSKLVDGRLVVCNLACEGLNNAAVGADLTLRKLYIGNLAPDISSETLLTFFGKHGEIEEGSVAYDKDTNTSRGFGFVTYRTPDAARKAVADSNKFLGGRSLTVRLADAHKGKTTTQSQILPTVLPLAIPIPSNYIQSAKSPGRSAGALSYAPYLYQNPYSTAPPHYLLQSQLPLPYPLLDAKGEPYGIPSASPTGLSGFPYYLTKP